MTPAERDAALSVLQAVADDPSAIDGDERFKALVAKIHRRGKRGKRSRGRSADLAADRALAAQSGVAAPAPLPMLPAAAAPADYRRPKACYVCKQSFTRAHPFYHALCPPCAERNWAGRTRRADLTGRSALVTGGRIKIGYQVVLKLLRDGAAVRLTTRFPADALRRLSAEVDYDCWRGRVSASPLDLRDLPSVEAFARNWLDSGEPLDVLIHNAAQTVKRPLAFYRHLLDAEALPVASAALARAAECVLVEARPGYAGHLPGTDAFFPAALDRDGQQVDARPHNSWRLKLGEVSTVELLETLLVGSVAPFVLTGRLLPALAASPFARRFVVNVSAMEGQFGRANKTAFHPHTNMAKAALNMLTRTAGADLAERGVYVTSVDTGWVTDEDPLPRAEWKREQLGFYPPLDAVDGAARVLDPIFRGVSEAAEPPAGVFLKDYEPYPW